MAILDVTLIKEFIFPWILVNSQFIEQAAAQTAHGCCGDIDQFVIFFYFFYFFARERQIALNNLPAEIA